MLYRAKELNILTDKLLLAIVFHDIVYNPRNSDNELKSAELFKSYLDQKQRPPNITLKNLFYLKFNTI
jgi:predicted metal-dependent HD superfamily phosphohydrolase